MTDAPRGRAAGAVWRGRGARGRVDRNRFAIGAALEDAAAAAWITGSGVSNRLISYLFDVRLRQVGPADRRRGDAALKRRSLEHAKPTAAIALDPDEALTLASLQQIHQAAEAVAALVEAALGLPQDMFDVRRYIGQRAPVAARESLAGATHAVGLIAERRTGRFLLAAAVASRRPGA